MRADVAPVASIVADHQPTLVVLAEMSPRRLVLERLVRESGARRPTARIVVVAEDADARWLGGALSAGATAVIPGGPSAEALGTVLQEVLDPTRPPRRSCAGRVSRESALGRTKEGA